MGLFTVKTAVFEGPLELLLELIEKRKLFISDVSLAEVADDYVTHVEHMEEHPVADTAQFLLIASTLVLIKSKSLLPGLTLTQDEEADIKELETRLAIYQVMRDAAKHVSDRYGLHVLFPRSSGEDVVPVFAPPKHLSRHDMHEAMQNVLNALPKVEPVPQAVVRKVVSLDEMIQNLAERIQKGIQVGFNEFSDIGKKERQHVIVSFLAMLELVKQGVLLVTQRGHFEDITMESKQASTPNYS